VLVLWWIAAALVVSTGMLYILAVTLAMAGAFAGLSAAGVYHGVDGAGQPQDPVSRNLAAFYAGGLFAFGAVGGKVVQLLQRRSRADG